MRIEERDPKRMDATINSLRAAWHRYPGMRLGQLVFFLAEKANEDLDPFYIEDDVLAKSARASASAPRGEN
jgi:uncharacterized protein YihD (DUF1040 family)